MSQRDTEARRVNGFYGKDFGFEFRQGKKS
jgi:hypothetical protein